jgi:hypothetical protein
METKLFSSKDAIEVNLYIIDTFDVLIHPKTIFLRPAPPTPRAFCQALSTVFPLPQLIGQSMNNRYKLYPKPSRSSSLKY